MAAERASGSVGKGYGAGAGEGITFEGRVANLETGFIAVQERMDHISATVIRFGDDTDGLRTTMENTTTTALQQVNEQFSIHQAALMTVINEARAEFDSLKRNLQGLYGGTGATFQEVHNKVRALEQEVQNLRTNPPSGGNGGGGGGMRGFLPTKSQVPKTFGKKESDWRMWQEDVATYLDTMEPGIAAVLKRVEKATTEIDSAWLLTNSDPAMVSKSCALHRCLRALTEDEPRMVVMGVRDEAGFEAWRLLHMRFGLATAAKQGQAMSEVMSVASKPCRTPLETRARVVELERRIRVAEEITGQQLDSNHAKSVLAMLLDPLTRAHTTHLLGATTDYQALKRGVLEFAANNVAATQPKTDPMAMDIGAVQEQGKEEEEDWDDADGDEKLAAISASTQCLRCGGYGHIARQCPSQNKGKGKGGGPSKGKGKGSGQHSQSNSDNKGKGKSKGAPQKGCWICQGPHYQDACPYNTAQKGHFKGGGGAKGYSKGAYNLEEWPQPGEVRALCHLRTHNRFAALAEQENTPKVQMLGSLMESAGGDVTRGLTNAMSLTGDSGCKCSANTGSDGKFCDGFSGVTKFSSGVMAKKLAQKGTPAQATASGTLARTTADKIELNKLEKTKDINHLANATAERIDTGTNELDSKKSEVDKVFNNRAGQATEQTKRDALMQTIVDETAMKNSETTKLQNGTSYKAALTCGRWRKEPMIGQPQTLSPLMTIEPGAGREPMTEAAWERVDFAVDSGASETVMPVDVLRDLDLKQGEANRRGVLYEVANGDRIPNLGERDFTGSTHLEGIQRRIKAQVCEVSKPLLSVAKLVRAGNSVVFSPSGSYVHDPTTGDYMALQEKAGMYVLSMWAKTGTAPGF